MKKNLKKADKHEADKAPKADEPSKAKGKASAKKGDKKAPAAPKEASSSKKGAGGGGLAKEGIKEGAKGGKDVLHH
uniref:Uncharacterized protein n=1 Tax=Rhabditophanes sp. KR3021 TaxID=114890 RepID=A0AC35TXZ6_9BILA